MLDFHYVSSLPLIPAGPSFPDRALQRAGDAERIPGNAVTLLCDGPQVFPAWLEDIAAARRFVLFENYIINNDRIGNQLTDALCERARAGVAVHLLYDWFGCIGTSHKLWRRLAQAGVEVRAFNPVSLTAPLGLLQRNHRKSLCIDGLVGYVAGLCVGDAWAGDPDRQIPPWRDTAVRVAGPAVAEMILAFNETWSTAGPPLRDAFLPPPRQAAPHGEPPKPPAPTPGSAPVRVVSGLPGRSRIYRLTSVLLTAATRRIWITDAYFLTPPALYESLLAAARDGIDVRVLLPGRSDLPWISWMSRSGYTGLLSAGVRIFEWEGPMLHAKTSVIDGLWCRVGSSNLNLSSLMTNWELDILVEDPVFAVTMEEMFLADQRNASELVLRRQARFRGKIQLTEPEILTPAGLFPEAPAGTEAEFGVFSTRQAKKARRGATTPGGRAGAVVARASAAVLGVALRRQFEQSAWSIAGVTSTVLILLGSLTLWRPAIVGLLIGVVLLWLGVAALGQALSQWWQRDQPRGPRARRRRRLHLPFQRRRETPVPDGAYLQQAKGSAVSQVTPPPNHTEP